MAWRISLLATSCFLAASILQAGEATDPRALVRQLGSDKYAVRQAASKALVKVGAPALPYLIEAARQGDLETRLRADLIYRKIQDRLLAAEVFKSRTVRFQFTEEPLRSVLHEINATTGLSFHCNIGDDRELVTVDIGPLPLWQALDEFYRKSGWVERRVLPFAHQDTDREGQFHPSGPYLAWAALPVRPGKRFEKLVDFQGPFRIAALPAELYRGPPNPRQNLLFFLEFRVDPAVPLIGIGSVAVHSLRDDHGQSRKVPPLIVIPKEQQPFQAMAIEGQGNTPPLGFGCLIVPISPGADEAFSWSEAKGTIAAHVRVKQQFVEIKDLANIVGQEFPGPYGFSIKVLDAKVREDGDLQIRLRAENLQAFSEIAAQALVVRVRPGFVALRGPADIAGDHIELLDAKGRSLVRRSLASKPLPNNPDGVDLTLIFQGPVDALASLRLVVAVPRSVAVEVPFTLRNKVVP